MTYQAALLEYLALSKLEDELRGQDRIELRSAVSERKNKARDKIERHVCPHDEPDM
jgi:hypothetical protein